MRRRPISERIAGAYTTGPDCWEWTRGLDGKGYGQIMSDGPRRSPRRAHRVVYELLVGPIAVGLYLCHKCDNRKCVRPDHMFTGTHRDNMDDALRKGRIPDPPKMRGSGHAQAKLTESDVIDIRSLRALGATYADLSKSFGVTKGAISHIISGRQWRHV